MKEILRHPMIRIWELKMKTRLISSSRDRMTTEAHIDTTSDLDSLR
jgi:hypothetical protein